MMSMETHFDVSVVVPFYNVGPEIEQTLRSIECQEGVNVEILVVDDGSAPECATAAFGEWGACGRFAGRREGGRTDPTRTGSCPRASLCVSTASGSTPSSAEPESARREGAGALRARSRLALRKCNNRDRTRPESSDRASLRNTAPVQRAGAAAD